MQTKKFIAKAFGKLYIVDAIKNPDNHELYIVLDGNYLRDTWFTSNNSKKPHINAKLINGQWTLSVYKGYILKECSSLEAELF